MHRRLCKVYNMISRKEYYQWLSPEMQYNIETYRHISVSVVHIFDRKKLSKAIKEANELEKNIQAQITESKHLVKQRQL